MREIRYTILHCVCENFCDSILFPFTVPLRQNVNAVPTVPVPDLTYSEKVTDLDKAHHGHEQPHHRHLDLDLGVTSEIFTVRVNKTSLILFLIVSSILYFIAFFMFIDSCNFLNNIFSLQGWERKLASA
jgi:hypothetical protein